jgi:hypothetical protein
LILGAASRPPGRGRWRHEDPAEVVAFRAAGEALLDADPLTASAGVRALLWLDHELLAEGELASFFATCDRLADADIESFCLVEALRTLGDGHELLERSYAEPSARESDFAAFEAAVRRTAESNDQSRRLAGLQAVLSLEKGRLGPTGATQLLAACRAVEEASGWSGNPTRHLFRWLLYEDGLDRLSVHGGFEEADLAALVAAARRVLADDGRAAGEAERLLERLGASEIARAG